MLLPPASLLAATSLKTVVVLESLASGATKWHRLKAQSQLPQAGVQLRWMGAAWEKAAAPAGAESQLAHSL